MAVRLPSRPGVVALQPPALTYCTLPRKYAKPICVGGAGLGQFLRYQVRMMLETGKVKRVLVGFEPAPLSIHAICQPARLLSSNVRARVDWAVPRLRARVPA